MQIGLKRGAVKLCPYDPARAQEFEREKLILQNIFGDPSVLIEHIGSTAVPGMIAKPIIDIEVGFAAMSDWQTHKDTLCRAGYNYNDAWVERDKVVMPKGPESCRTHHLHMTRVGSDEWNKVISFRDRLRNDADFRDTYSELKQRLARDHAGNRDEYRRIKSRFIEIDIADA